MLLTIFFNDQFCVALIERQSEGKYFSSLHTFGKEPSDNQIFDFVNYELPGIISRQSEFVKSDEFEIKKSAQKD